MTPSRRTAPRRSLVAALVFAAAVSLAGPLVGAAPSAGAAPAAAAMPAQAQCGTDLSANPAAPQLSVGTTTLPASGAATVTVSGSRYLTGRYVCGASKFGGVYVFFGWVQPGGQWGPSWRSATSSAGQFGTTYTYPGEGGGGETRDDGSGTLRLVAFTAGGTSGNETPFHMDANGNWSTTLTVAGPVFAWKDLATGASRTVDCRVVQCGIYTTGAHGIASRSNEQFVPVSFAGGAPSTTAAPVTTPPATSGASAPTGPDGAPASVQGAQAAAGAASGSAGRGSTTTTVSPGSTSVAPGSAGTDRSSVQIDRSAPRGDSEDNEDAQGAEVETAMASVDDVEGGSGAAPFVGIAVVVLVGTAATAALVRRRQSHRPGADPSAN